MLISFSSRPFSNAASGLVDRRGRKENFSRAAPDHGLALGHFLVCLNIGPQLLRQVALVLALLDIGAVQTLD